MTPEQRAYCAARTRARLAQKKAAARIRPAAFTALERTGTVDESIRPLVPAVDAWRARRTEDLGGPDALSMHYESLLSVASVLLLNINTLTAMFLQGSGDRLEIASKIGRWSASSARRSRRERRFLTRSDCSRGLAMTRTSAI